MTEQKTFSNGIAAQVLGLASASEAMPQKEVTRTSIEEDLLYNIAVPFNDAEMVFEGPIAQLGKLYSAIESAYQKAQAAKEAKEYREDGAFLMKEMFPNFLDDCDAWDAIADWDIYKLSFDGTTIKMYTSGCFTYPENFIDNILENYPDIKAYYFMTNGVTEFYTNDSEGKYFNQRYFLHAEWVTCWDAPKIINEFFASKEDAFKFLSNEDSLAVENEDDFLANNMVATQAVLREINIVGQEPKNDSLAVIHGKAWRPCA